jgi:hypothetical protein
MRVGSLSARHECLPLFRVVLLGILRGAVFLPFIFGSLDVASSSLSSSDSLHSVAHVELGA